MAMVDPSVMRQLSVISAFSLANAPSGGPVGGGGDSDSDSDSDSGSGSGGGGLKVGRRLSVISSFGEEEEGEEEGEMGGGD
jgi:hypothetical protein